MAGNRFKLDFMTVLLATCSGLALFFSAFCSIYAMKSGTISLNSMFSTAGMIIPILAGVFLFDRQVFPMQFVGLVVFFVSAYLLINASKTVYTNFSCKTLLLLVGPWLRMGVSCWHNRCLRHMCRRGMSVCFLFFLLELLQFCQQFFMAS